MSTVPCITTSRLRLRPASMVDLPAMEQALADPRFPQDLLLARMRRDLRLTNWLQRMSAEPARPKLWAITKAGDEACIGTVALVDEVASTRTGVLSYWLAPVAWGQGLATEAVGALLERVAATAGYERVIAVTARRNASSLRLLARLGFCEEAETLGVDEAHVRMQRLIGPPAALPALSIRRLDRSDAAAFQQLRIFALQESASAFGSSVEEECERSIEQVQAWLTGSAERVFFGAFEHEQLCGVVGIGREQGLKARHIAFVRSMFVAPDARGLRVGRQLLQAALQQASGWRGVEQVTLAVTAGNEPAECLYRSLGFVEVGRMPRALRIGADDFDELSMVLRLDASLSARNSAPAAAASPLPSSPTPG